MKKGFVLPLIIIIVVAITVVGVFYLGKKSLTSILNQTTQPQASPTPDPTASWKTYQGETAYTHDGSSMFTIKYPADWTLKGNVLYPLGQTSEKNTDNGTDISFTLGAGGRELGGGAYEKEQKEFPAGKFFYYWGEKDILAVLDKGNQSYIFEAHGNFGQDQARYRMIFDQMLSTFKFTN